MPFEAVIGLETHAELETRSKMFCSCPLVDVTTAGPNQAVCPVCAGMPGVLPVVNQAAVEYALRVALALNCEIALTSLFARKNYFYPDLPKGYQISQYDQPLARGGYLPLFLEGQERRIRIRRVHLEEDTGRLTHVVDPDGSPEYSLVDLNRAGVPLLEIVTEPDFRTPAEVRAYAVALRAILRYLQVNSGDMQKGVLRIEPNVSVREAGSQQLGTRVEIKNLNSLQALERSVAYEIRRQSELLSQGNRVRQETVGWDPAREETFTQRVKEEEDDYRYFPEPDLPPLTIEPAWLDQIWASLPELPQQRLGRFQSQYGLSEYDAGVLTADRETADFFEKVVSAGQGGASAKEYANWICGELFALLNQSGLGIESVRIKPSELAELVQMVKEGAISKTSARSLLAEILASGGSPRHLAAERGLSQISDRDQISQIVALILAENPDQVGSYLEGKETLSGWFFGQAMRAAGGRANPQVVRQELERLLQERKKD
jgi:aspartyl-tRNA(Asn)/glutamyl-tRNA(Gln) amidotransferase subunit B